MNDAPEPPLPKRRGRPPSWINSARAMFARVDLKGCNFVLGPWLQSMHPHTLECLIKDLDRYIDGPVNAKAERYLILVIMALLEREAPEAEGFAMKTINGAFNRLVVYAQVERDRRAGLVAIDGVPALSADNGVKLVALEGLAQALTGSQT